MSKPVLSSGTIKDCHCAPILNAATVGDKFEEVDGKVLRYLRCISNLTPLNKYMRKLAAWSQHPFPDNDAAVLFMEAFDLLHNVKNVSQSLDGQGRHEEMAAFIKRCGASAAQRWKAGSCCEQRCSIRR